MGVSRDMKGDVYKRQAAGRVELLKLRQEAEQRIAELRAKKVEQERQQETQLQAEQSLFQAQSSFQEGLLEICLLYTSRCV